MESGAVRLPKILVLMEGASWSIAQAPHMDGLYYDGINFGTERSSLNPL